jgi:septal ring factor EnvC (AmiA/AmiB activator)
MSDPKEPMQQLLDLIGTMITEGTFSASALAGIQTLKAKAEALAKETTDKQTTIDRLQRENSAKEQEITQQRGDIRRLTERLEGIEAREAAVLAREIKQEVADTKLACEKEKVSLVTDMFKTVFKPSSVRETLFGTIPVPVEGMPGGGPGNSYPCPGTVQQAPTNLTRTTEKE